MGPFRYLQPPASPLGGEEDIILLHMWALKMILGTSFDLHHWPGNWVLWQACHRGASETALPTLTYEISPAACSWRAENPAGFSKHSAAGPVTQQLGQ